MSRKSRAAIFAAMAMVWASVSVSAETLRCRSVNGNLNCAGTGAVSCQTVNGTKVCTSGGGDVVQTFGNHAPADDAMDAEGDDIDDGYWLSLGQLDHNPKPAVKKQSINRD